MKQKYKSPEMMQEKGIDFHVKLLKKTVKAMMSAKEKTVETFFYDTEFDFGNGQDPHPVLFIGEIPTKWKKYMKAHKASKSFAYGDCIIDEDGSLKMQAKVGKGAKDMVLKKVNKFLLKPYCKAYFVDAISTDAPVAEDNAISENKTETVATDDAPEAATTTNNQLQDWLANASNIVGESKKALTENLKILGEFEKPLSDIKNIVVTDAFIAKAKKAKQKVKDLTGYLLNLEAFKKSGSSYQKDSKEADDLMNQLDQERKQIQDNQAKIEAMLKNMENLEQISNPKDAEIPVIEDDPILNFLNRIKKVYT